VRSKRLAWCVRYYPIWGYENSLREAVKYEHHQGRDPVERVVLDEPEGRHPVEHRLGQRAAVVPEAREPAHHQRGDQRDDERREEPAEGRDHRHAVGDGQHDPLPQPAHQGLAWKQYFTSQFYQY
jgi:hypothetical protein